MADVVFSCDAYVWQSQNGTIKDYIPQGINLYWGGSGSPYFTNAYKSAMFLDLAQAHVEIAYVSDASFQCTDAFGNWYNAREDSGYWGFATGGWFTTAYLQNMNGIFPIFTDRTQFIAYITDPTPPTPPYTWQSVQAVTGKNGVSLELAHHLDVNDGEPITTEDTTKFSRKWINNVGRIIETKLNE